MQAVVGLVRHGIMPERGQVAEAAAAVRAGEAADRHGHAVDERHRGVVPRHRGEPPPERELDGPQVRRLPCEGGTMDRAKAGEQVAEVAPEVGVQAPVGVEAEELADDLDRQHLAVGEDRRRAALAQSTLAAQVADEVVHEAEGGNDEGLQVHDRPPLRLNPRKERPGATMAPSATRSLGNLHIGLASERKTTKRPCAEIDGTRLKMSPCWPVDETLTRSVVPSLRSRTKMSSCPLVSPGTRF